MEAEYEIKFHIYDGNEQEISKFNDQYISLKEKYREEGSVISRVLAHFFEGLEELTNGDMNFWENNYDTAHEHYNEANRMFNRFKNSRNVTARLDFLAERLIHRTNGLEKLVTAFQSNDLDEKEELCTKALEEFNEEVSIANKMEENMSSYASFSRAAFAEAQLLLYSSKKEVEQNSGNAKKMLMNARNSIRQAAFIDPRLISRVYNIVDELDDLTKNRITNKAEDFADQATVASENGEFLKAKEGFKKASMFYQRASTLASDTSSRRKLLSQATLYQSSELEAVGNQLFRVDNNTVAASEKYEEAAKLVDKSIALMGRFGSSTLEDSFAAQRDYYKAMGYQTKAITLLDNEEYQEAKDIFTNAIELFDKVIDNAKSGDIEVLIRLSEEAKSDIKGYLSMCEIML